MMSNVDPVPIASTVQKLQSWTGNFGANPDPEALARAAQQALTQGDAFAAFALADRRCRVLVPAARDLFLRAEAHRAAGRLVAAQQDLEAALALDPTDPLIDAAALGWGTEAQRRDAAERIAARAAGSWRLRRQAVAALFAAGQPCVHRFVRTSRYVSGWVAWRGAAPFRIEMSGCAVGAFVVEPDPGHPLAVDGISAAEVAIETPEAGPLSLTLRSPDGAPETVALRDSRRKPPEALAPAEAPADVVVIVPVYEDLEATRACLDSLARACEGVVARVLVIDDASPNADIRALLDERAAAGAFALTRNASNLGFAATVNLALARRGGGDALLLNSDTLLPPGAVARLRALAHSAPDVGAVTPFSNNGELTSYPVRNEANPLPPLAEVERLDALARAANGDALVDLPNGVGFCLYITAPCLEAVGPLPEIYAEGYYEDVEFCLRAREKGFRNVAAPGIYVGHAGSRSFTTRKRALVTRNLALIESRFPGYRLETAAFVALDPLQPYRAALDAAQAPPARVQMIVCGPGSAAELGRARAEAAPGPALRLEFDSRGAATLTATGGAAPQSLRFGPDAAGLAETLAKTQVERIAWLDPGATPDAALDALIDLGAPIDLLCGDLAWFAPPPTPHAGGCPAPEARDACAACREMTPTPEELERQRLRRPRLARVMERAAGIVPLDPLAESFALRVFKGRAVAYDGPAMPARPLRGRITTLGALYPHRTAAGDRLLARLARRLAAGEARLVVLGGAMDDAALMASGAAFVTGPVAPAERLETARRYGVDGLLAPSRSGGYGGVAALAAALAAPQAYFDWTFGAFPVAPGDLSLDPRVCDDKAAAEIAAWMDEVEA